MNLYDVNRVKAKVQERCAKEGVPRSHRIVRQAVDEVLGVSRAEQAKETRRQRAQEERRRDEVRRHNEELERQIEENRRQLEEQKAHPQLTTYMLELAGFLKDVRGKLSELTEEHWEIFYQEGGSCFVDDVEQQAGGLVEDLKRSRKRPRKKIPRGAL
jgi:hypothetical protein